MGWRMNFCARSCASLFLFPYQQWWSRERFKKTQAIAPTRALAVCERAILFVYIYVRLNKYQTQGVNYSRGSHCSLSRNKQFQQQICFYQNRHRKIIILLSGWVSGRAWRLWSLSSASSKRINNWQTRMHAPWQRERCKIFTPVEYL